MQLNSENTDQPILSSPNGSKPPVVGSTVILGDCVEVMKGFEDNQFDLAIVDPPYACEELWQSGGNTWGKRKEMKAWDKAPTLEYFTELFRVSKNQIICGGNYFDLPISRGWICWDKITRNMWADGELIWTSFNRNLKIFNYSKADANINDPQYGRIHPTQKPIKLYDMFLKEYSEPGQRILDTHLGGGSSRIAADKAGLDFTGIEIDKEYFDLSEKRFKQYKSQLRIEGW